jgi:hypothetical protein
MKAARSASETQLRGKATSSLKGKGKGRGVLRAVTLARVASAVDKAQKGRDKDASKPIEVKSERVERAEKPQAPRTVKSERVEKRPASGAKSVTRGQKALPGPKPTTAPKSKGKKSPKRETTPGYQKVYKATPAVDLNEGPNFGKTTSIIEPTFQPKTPKKKKNA